MLVCTTCRVLGHMAQRTLHPIAVVCGSGFTAADSKHANILFEANTISMMLTEFAPNIMRPAAGYTE
jgi:hypothetical protein